MPIAVLFMIAKIENMKNGGMIIQCITLQATKISTNYYCVKQDSLFQKKNQAE